MIRAVAQLRGVHTDLQLVAVGGGDDLPALAGTRKRSRHRRIACISLKILRASKSPPAMPKRISLHFPVREKDSGWFFLEAMAFSKAVVGAAWGGTTDVVEDGVNGRLLVPPRDPGRLEHALGRLLGDESLRKQVGQRGAKIVRQKYRFDIFQAELETILGKPSLRGIEQYTRGCASEKARGVPTTIPSPEAVPVVMRLWEKYRVSRSCRSS